MPTVYLAGAIAECTDEECVEWRREATRLLAFRGISVLDPMRRDYRKRVFDVPPAEIVLPDLADIRAFSALLVWLAPASWGTAMEIAYAAQWGRPVAMVGDLEDCVSPWLRYHASGVYADLPAAVDALSGWIA